MLGISKNISPQHRYRDIAEMLAKHYEQRANDLIEVDDATEDGNLNFPATETRRQALYMLDKKTTLTLSDYKLLSAPLSNVASGLERITENEKTGWRLIGRNPDNFGNIGEDAIDFSVSTINDSTKGATGKRSMQQGLNNITSGTDGVTIGLNNRNNLDQSLVIGDSVKTESTPNSNGCNIIVGDVITGGGALGVGINTYNNLYGNIIIGADSYYGTPGSSKNVAVIYSSVIGGVNNNIYAAHGSLAVGSELLGGAARCATVGAANIDLTQTTASSISGTHSAYNPRFIVGVGNWNSYNNTGTRANGFVVMSDGKASVPEQTIAHIVAIGARAVATKEYVDTNHTATEVTGTVLQLSNVLGSTDISPLPSLEGTFTVGPNPVLFGIESRYIATTGKTKFPILEDATYVEASIFEANAFYFLWACNTGLRIEYWFEKTPEII